MQTPHLAKSARNTATVTVLLLLVPFVAMQFSSEVSWGPGDFLAAAVLLFSAGMAYAVWAHYVRTLKQRVTAAVVVLAVMATIWAVD